MTRTDALAKIRRQLLDRLNELRSSISSDANNLYDTNSGGDAADIAFESIEGEIASRLAEHGSNEINQILRAIDRIDSGCYGICEECQRKITVARLTILPYCTFCIDCQRNSDVNH